MKPFNPKSEILASDITLFNFLNSIDSGYFVVDRNAKIIFFNPAFARWHEQLFGYKVQTGSGITHLEKIDNGFIAENLEAVFRGEKVEHETKNTDELNSFIWFYIRMTPLLNDEETITGVIVYLADISERKRDELALKKSSELHRFVAKITSDAIWDWDFRTGVLKWSEGYETTFGYVIPENVEEVNLWGQKIHSEDRERVIEKLNNAIKNPEVNYWEDEYRFIKADGSIAYIYDRGHIIYEKGKIVRIVGSMSDITARKLFDLEKEQITNSLIQRNKDLEQFSYIISHNLRSQIANSLGLVDILASGYYGEEEKDELYRQLNFTVGKMDDIVKDLSQILHVKRNIYEKKQPVDVQELFNDVLELLTDNIREAKGVVNLYADSGTSIFTVKSYLHSIFYNLISNAVKYRNPKEQLAIRVEINDRNEMHEIVFTDNGMGIDTNLHENNLFGLYKRFHAGIEGKGMGLFMVKAQVEIMGGSISIKSLPGKGSAFTVTLPKGSLPM